MHFDTVQLHAQVLDMRKRESCMLFGSAHDRGSGPLGSTMAVVGVLSPTLTSTPPRTEYCTSYATLERAELVRVARRWAWQFEASNDIWSQSRHMGRRTFAGRGTRREKMGTAVVRVMLSQEGAHRQVL